MQSDTLEEWYALKFCFKLGKNATETLECLRLFGGVLHESNISLWEALEIQGRQGVCEGWWEVWEE